MESTIAEEDKLIQNAPKDASDDGDLAAENIAFEEQSDSTTHESGELNPDRDLAVSQESTGTNEDESFESVTSAYILSSQHGPSLPTTTYVPPMMRSRDQPPWLQQLPPLTEGPSVPRATRSLPATEDMTPAQESGSSAQNRSPSPADQQSEPVLDVTVCVPPATQTSLGPEEHEHGQPGPQQMLMIQTPSEYPPLDDNSSLNFDYYDLLSAPAAPNLHVSAGAIQFSNVTYAYDASSRPPALRNVSFRVEPGEHIAIVGLPGAGKSTLMKLLLGVNEGYGGRIEIDGQDISLVSRESLLAQIAVAPQDGAALNASIFDNVRFGRAASRESVEEACRAVGIHDRIFSLPSGYDSLLGPGGIGCSKADLQKLGVARLLLLADAKIVVVDEALGSVDRQTECRVLRYLRGWCAGKTTITVAHRLGAITLSDRIYVFWNGMIVESGRHAELMGRSGLYRRLWTKKDMV